MALTDIRSRLIAGGSVRPRPGKPCTPETRRCDFWNWGPGYRRPACCTDHMVQLSEFVHTLLDRHDILHWVDFGALLGAVRDGQLIPWDEDVDLGMLAEDRDAVLRLKPEIERAGHRLAIAATGWLRVNLSVVNTLHVDLWLWSERDGQLVPAWSEERESKCQPGMPAHHAFPSHYVERLETVHLGGCELPAPSPVEQFIVEHRYGPGFRTPIRQVLDKTRYPDIRGKNVTDLHIRLFEAIAEQESRLLAEERRSAGGLLAGVYAWERWIWSGRPRHPAAARLARLRGEWIEDGATDPLADELLESLATLEQAVDEEAGLSVATRARRLVRRGRRLAQKARRALHRPGLLPLGADQPRAS